MVKFKYKPLPSCVTIHESGIEGLGLFATEIIHKNENLGITHVAIDDKTLVRTPLGGFINHSDFPNCTLVSSCNDAVKELFTLRKINKDEELVLYYTIEQDE